MATRAARRLEAFEEAEQFLDRYRAVRGEDDDLLLERVLLRAIAKANGLIKVLLEPNQGCSRIGTASSNSFPFRQNSLECLGFSEELNEITRTRAFRMI